jgi:asparagine synthase (glutamine-hydrolysing)
MRTGEPPHREAWWSLQEAPDLDGTPGELAERYRELLLDAVGIRLAATDRPAFTLSGGMDSSSVLASAVALTGERQHAYSTVYAHAEYDESDEIRSMLDLAVAEWHQVPIGNRPDVVGLVEDMVAAHDEPVATATWLSHHVLCGEVAGAGFDTLFGGLGGDELNAGEYEYFFFNFADLRAAGREEELREEVAEWVRHHDHPIFRKSYAVMEEGLARTVDLRTPGRILPDRARIERYNAALAPGFYDLREFDPVMDRVFASYLRNRTYQDLFRETAPCCLRAEDRQTSAAGLRNCDPFFDHRLAELMFRVPGELKIRHGVTKQLLRRATEGLLPEETRTRIKKTGWNAPADNWFSGPGRDLLHDVVGSAAFDRGIYDLAEVRRVIDEHDEIVRSGAAAENHMMFLWQLVNLDAWLRWLDALPRP